MWHVCLGRSEADEYKTCLYDVLLGDTAYWIVKREQAFKVIHKARELGINFYDVANAYYRKMLEKIGA